MSELISKLYANDEWIGDLLPAESEFPWLVYRFRPTPHYAKYAHTLEAPGEPKLDGEQIERCSKLTLRLEYPDGWSEEILAFTVHEGMAATRAGCIKRSEEEIAREHRTLWEEMGDEFCAEKCRMSDCSRVRLRDSVYCKRHHIIHFRGIDLGEGPAG